MRLLFIVLSFVLYSAEVKGQDFIWAQSYPIDYTLNPSYPEHPVTWDEFNGRVVSSRLDSSQQVYGSAVFGNCILESRDANGVIQWQLGLDNKVVVQRIQSDPQGNIYVGGRFMETMYIGATDSIESLGGPVFSVNTFLIKLDTQGNVIWKRNVNTTWPMADGIEAIGVEASGDCWYAMTDFFAARIIKLDANGNELQSHVIENGKTIGNIDFDPWGGMFVSGAAEQGNFIMDQDTFQVIHQYNMFIARFDPLGQPSWASFAYDITFQRPMISADLFGNVYFLGFRYDSTSFENIIFTHPPVPGDFFMVKADSSGNFLWGKQQPPLIIGPFGSLEPGNNVCIGNDASGRVFISAIQRGPVDWGNGISTNTPNISDRRIVVACIDSANNTQWVKMGGGEPNFIHAIAVSDAGDCYFSGIVGDTSAFDTIQFNTGNFINSILGKISIDSTTSVNEISYAQLNIYPNPSYGMIEMDEKLIDCELEVYEINGKRVLHTRIYSQLIDLRKFSPGVYLIKIKKDELILKGKLILL